MKIALINPAELEMSPYVRTYVELFDQSNIDYDVIEWRRDLSPKNDDEIISFNYPASISKKPYLKLYDYWRYAQFVKKIVSHNKYDKLIVFEYQTTLFLKHFLINKYRHRYIVDIRDYSKLYRYIKNYLKPVDKNAYARVISSPGYSEWTVPIEKEIICHNTTIERLNRALDVVENPLKKPLTILTNGILRTFNTDSQIVDMFNGTDVRFVFAGKGKDSGLYQMLSQKSHNVKYVGYYRREDELELARNASLINIFLEDDMCYNTAFSNRFYLSLIVGVPMIVNSQNIQAKYVKQFSLGIVATNIQEIPHKIRDYVEKFDIHEYNKGRRQMISMIKNDLETFAQEINHFSK